MGNKTMNRRHEYMELQRRFLCLVFMLITYFLLFSASAYAEEQAEVTAEHLEYLSQTNMYSAKGSVRIVLQNSHLSADEMLLNNVTSDAVATGNVVYEDPHVIMNADKINLNLRTKLGTVYNSHLFYKTDNFHLRGEAIEKTGDRSFSLNRASVTTCDGDSPAWHVSGEDIKIDGHKSLSSRHTKFHIKDIPVFYTPYFWAPLIEKRQTGLLFPSFGYSSSKGTYYKQGFFWAPKEYQDATFYLDYSKEMDFAQGLDYRYILSPDFNGELWAYHAREKEPARDLVEIKSYHNLTLPHEISAYLKLHAVNEFDYYETLDSTSFQRFGLSSWESDPFVFASDEKLQKHLESNLHISKNFSGGRAYLLAQTRQSLEGPSNEIPQSLPEIGLINNPFSKGPLAFNSAIKGVNFWRKDGQKGYRLDIYPNLSISYGRMVNFSQRIGVRETAYILDNPNISKSRLLFDLGTTLTTKFFREYPSLVHLIEPSLEYDYIPSVNHDNIPFFDSTDSVPHTSNIKYSLTNRISGLSSPGMESRFRISQRYSFLNIDKRFSPVLLETSFSSANYSLSLNSSYDVHDRMITETIAAASMSNKKGYISLGENYRRSSALDQVTFEAGIFNPVSINNIRLPLDLRGILWYDLNGNGVQEFRISSTYTHQCWAMSVSFIKKPSEYQVVFLIELKGLGTLNLGSI